MNKYDQLLVDWFRKYKDHLDPKFQSLDDIVDAVGWPSERLPGGKYAPEHYMDELEYIFNSNKDNFGVPLPFELTAAELSIWAGNEIPVNHPLIQQRDKWRAVLIDGEFGQADPANEKRLWTLLAGIARGRAKDNLGTFEELTEYQDAPELTGEIYTTFINGRPIVFVVSDETVAFMDRKDGHIKVFDFDGNELHKGANHTKIQSYITRAPMGSGSMLDKNALASVIGNTLSSILLNDIDLFDLP